MLSATCYKNESTMCEQMTALINLEQDIIYSSIGYLGLDLLYECLRQKKNTMDVARLFLKYSTFNCAHIKVTTPSSMFKFNCTHIKILL